MYDQLNGWCATASRRLPPSHDGQFVPHNAAMLAGPLHHALRNCCIANKYPDPALEIGGLAVRLKYPQASLHYDYICCTNRILPDFVSPNGANILAYVALLRLSPVL